MAKKHRKDTPPPVGNVYLTGFMCAGKSSAGALLARALGRPFADSDAAVEKRAGMRVAELVRRRGLAAFRRLEAAEVRRLCSGSGLVAALGGGVYPSRRWRGLLERTGTVVFLDCRWRELERRLLAASAGRPLLAGQPRKAAARARRLYLRRLPYYRLAAFRVDTSGLTPRRAAQLIRKGL